MRYIFLCFSLFTLSNCSVVENLEAPPVPFPSEAARLEAAKHRPYANLSEVPQRPVSSENEITDAITKYQLQQELETNRAISWGRAEFTPKPPLETLEIAHHLASFYYLPRENSLRESDFDVVKKIEQTINKHPDHKLIIQAHQNPYPIEPVGVDKARADQLKVKLLEYGVTEDHIKIELYGPSLLRFAVPSKESIDNQRIDVLLIKKHIF